MRKIHQIHSQAADDEDSFPSLIIFARLFEISNIVLLDVLIDSNLYASVITLHQVIYQITHFDSTKEDPQDIIDH
jgi:hypothetical protein